jgi:hypothetical protein
VIFTVPHEFNALWRWNRRAFGEILIQCSRHTLMDLLRDAKYLGARPGVLLVLQTWRQDLGIHLHTHCVVTAGGLSAAGRWVQARKQCLLPRRVAMAVFRGKMREAILKGLQRGDLQVPEGTTGARWRGVANKLGRAVWNVKILERYEHGCGVMKYLGRYLKGGPISTRRIKKASAERVKLRGKGNSGGARAKLEMTPATFVCRYLEHAPVARMQYARGYGLYANGARAKREQARACLGQGPEIVPERPDWREVVRTHTGSDPDHCPVCGAVLIIDPIGPQAQSPPHEQRVA